MKKLTTLIVFALTLAATSCGGSYVAKVYGKSGNVYQAPSICAALVKCQQSEAECSYERTVWESGAETGCKQVESNSSQEKK